MLFNLATKPATVAESIPPDKDIPNLTSDLNLRLTAFSRLYLISSLTSLLFIFFYKFIPLFFFKKNLLSFSFKYCAKPDKFH